MNMNTGEEQIEAIAELVASESEWIESLFEEISKVVIGQEAMVRKLVIGLLCGGHCLLEGVPGLAKTLTVSTLAKCIGADFNRIQFTPDLLPADVVGTTVYNMHSGEFTKKKGPIFANLILADEINRAPAKVQSALLEAMQERQVTIGDETESLPDPFLVLATQNPIEHEGTYALPEAQLDRFMMLIKVGYPTKEEERAIMDQQTSTKATQINSVVSLSDIADCRQTLGKIYVDESLRDYIIRLVHATRKPKDLDLVELEPMIEFGASPRASISLLQAARAHALIDGRGYVTPEDIKSMGQDILRHRVVLTYEAEAEEITSEEIVSRLFEKVEIP